MTDKELGEAREAIEELRVRDCEYLADQLGSDPEDYRHDAEQSVLSVFDGPRAGQADASRLWTAVDRSHNSTRPAGGAPIHSLVDCIAITVFR